MTTEEAARALLLSLGLDVDSPGMKDTPKRIAKSMAEILCGYNQSPCDILCTDFPSEGYDGMVVLSNIGFHSTCEHHMLPFSGVATVGYIPKNGKVVGLSKLARLVDCFGRRMQIQERMTMQIAAALNDHLDPQGCGVVLKATHMCMVCRGVMKPNALMTTTSLIGSFEKDASTRAEFLRSVQ